MKIPNKQVMYALLEAGGLGPTLPIYRRFEAIPRESKTVGARYNRKPYEGSFCIPSLPLPLKDFWHRCRQYTAQGFALERFVFTVYPRMTGQLINAELSCVNGEATLFYSLDGELPMRPALQKSGVHKFGCGVWLLLRQLLPQETVNLLREMYDAWGDLCTIEFTGFDHAVTDGGCYVIVWEVRSY